MSKVAFVADIHYGFQDRLTDIDWAARTIIDYCRDNNIDTVINLGDLTHDRRSVNLDVYCALYQTLQYSLQQGVNWYTFLGNHDMYLKHSWEINSIKPISQVINLIDTVKILVLDNRRFWILPFIHFEKAYMRVLAKLEEQAEPGDNLLTHIGVRGASLNTCFLLKDWSYVNFENTKFNKVYTGHFHNHQTVGDKVVYPGSPLPFKFDEGGVPHGFLVYDTNTDTHEFIDILEIGRTQGAGAPLPPQFLTVLDSQLDGLEEYDVQHNALRVVLNRDYSVDEKLQIKLRLKEMGAKAVRWLSNNKDTKLLKTGGKIGTTAELFTRWIDADQPKGLNKQLLVQLELEVRHEGDERYTYETESD